MLQDLPDYLIFTNDEDISGIDEGQNLVRIFGAL